MSRDICCATLRRDHGSAVPPSAGDHPRTTIPARPSPATHLRSDHGFRDHGRRRSPCTTTTPSKHPRPPANIRPSPANMASAPANGGIRSQSDSATPKPPMGSLKNSPRNTEITARRPKIPPLHLKVQVIGLFDRNSSGSASDPICRAPGGVRLQQIDKRGSGGRLTWGCCFGGLCTTRTNRVRVIVLN
jgi:hypothetical protein